MKSLKKKLIELRKINGFTQQQLAGLVGVGKTTISNWEVGYSSPDTDNIQKLCDIFDVTSDYLFMDEIEKLGPITPTHKKIDAVSIPILEDYKMDESILVNDYISGHAYEAKARLKDNSYRYFFLRVKDDSMSAADINKSNLVLVKLKGQLKTGDIGVVFVEGKLLIRRINMSNRVTALQGESFGNVIDPIVFKKQPGNKIIGKVIEVRNIIGEDD
jgi:SOS-response transcriptional repressor LexA